ncbi:MAG: hypothetical protein ACREP9_04065, partial [Candidatus Dormibacteraceae bacterium]
RIIGVSFLEALFSQLCGTALMTLGTLSSLPDGWTLGSLGEILQVIETGSRPRGGVSSYSSGIVSLGAESIVGLGQYDFAKTKFVPQEYFMSMKRGIVSDRDVLLYKDGGRPGEFEPHATLVGEGFPFGTLCINEHVYRLRAKPPFFQEWLYFWLASAQLMDAMRRGGTGVAIPGLNLTAVRALPIAVPPANVLEKFRAVAEPLVGAVLGRARESVALSALRDVLLPRLLSGSLRVRDGGRLIGESM